MTEKIEHMRVPQGTSDWFWMVGRLMVEAGADLPASLNLTLVERYTDGVELQNGLVQGIRFDIKDGKPSFRVGANRNEQGDVTVEVTSAAARELNTIPGDDPAYAAARKRILAAGDMRVRGDASPLEAWLTSVHDMIVERTA